MLEKKLEFYKGELAKIREDIQKPKVFKNTQRYTNFMSLETNLSNLVNQIESMIKANEEQKERNTVETEKENV